ncbi:MAG: sigma-70 family RNA polymerase sigma factor [Planctomycetota bacterium]
MSLEQRGRIVLDLFEKYYDRVFCFARRTVDSSAAEDIAQEVFTRLLDHQGLETKTISVSYLIKVADNLIKRRYRQARRAERFASERAKVAGREETGQPSSRESAGGERGRRYLESLSRHEEDAVRLIVCRGLSYEQAARALGVRVTAVNNWKFRGIQRLRHHTGADGRRHEDDRAPGRHGRGGLGQRAG